MKTLTRAGFRTLALTIALSTTCTVSVFSQVAVSEVLAREIDLSIPASSLAESLIELGRQSGLRIVASDSVTGDIVASALVGRFTPEAAIDALLFGSELKAVRTTDGTYVIRRDDSSSKAPGRKRVTPPPETVAVPLRLDEILVYGTKNTVDAQSTIESVEVFTAERFSRENLFDIADALERTPNVSLIRGDLTTINIRGVNRNGTNGAGTGLAVNIFQDGVPLSNEALRFGSSTAWDIEQLEVLRGSQSNVQGRNSIAGAVVLQSKKPTYDWEYASRARFAEFGTLQTAGAVSGPIIPDQLAFRISADYQETDGFIDDQFSEDPFDSREALTVRGRFLIEPKAMSGLSALLTVEHNDRLNGDVPEVRSQAGDLGFDPQARTTFDERKITSDFESIKAIADITYGFSDSVTLKFLGTYEDADNVTVGKQRELNQPDTEFVRVGTENVTYSAEARLAFDFGALTGVLGGYYFNDDSNTNRSATLVISELVPFLIDPVDSVYRTDVQNLTDVENFALFTSWRYETSDKWTLDFAVRYDDERRTFERPETSVTTEPASCEATAPGFVVGLPTPDLVTVPCTFGEDALVPETEPLQSNSFGVLLPSAAATYHVTADASVFAGYRRGYRAGGTYLSQSFDAIDLLEVRSYDPEFLDTFEAGWRTQWLDQRLIVNGTVFYSEYEDQQIGLTDDAGFLIIANAAATSLYGLELSGTFRATPELELTASLGLLETNIDDFVVQEDDPNSPENEFLDLAGNDLDRSPNLSFNLGANYRLQSGFFAGVNLNYQGTYFSDIFNLEADDLGDGFTEKTDAATIVNAQVGYSFSDKVTVTVYGTNVFNEGSPDRINIGGQNAAVNPGQLLNEFQFDIRQPQTFGVTIETRF
ncbi:MAG: TonB-dependent receptor [Pseudomonadota bacterium]